MMKEVFPAKSCDTTGCPKCLSHYLKGKERCDDCHQPLEETQFRGKKRRLKDSTPSFFATLMANPFDDGFDMGAEDEPKAPLFRWNDPMTMNIVGFVVCVAILISMVTT